MPVRVNSLLCLLGDGRRGEELGISSPPLGCHSFLLEARVVLASPVFFLVLFVEGDMECVWFLLVAGERAWCRRLLVRSSRL